jgi:hypothetical protein
MRQLPHAPAAQHAMLHVHLLNGNTPHMHVIYGEQRGPAVAEVEHGEIVGNLVCCDESGARLQHDLHMPVLVRGTLQAGHPLRALEQLAWPQKAAGGRPREVLQAADAPDLGPACPPSLGPDRFA